MENNKQSIQLDEKDLIQAVTTAVKESLPREEQREALVLQHPGVAGRGTKSKTDLSDSDKSVDRFTLDTAKMLNVSEAKVKETLQLQDIKEVDKEKVRENKLNKSQALSIMRKENKIELLKELYYKQTMNVVIQQNKTQWKNNKLKASS